MLTAHCPRKHERLASKSPRHPCSISGLFPFRRKISMLPHVTKGLSFRVFIAAEDVDSSARPTSPCLRPAGDRRVSRISMFPVFIRYYKSRSADLLPQSAVPICCVPGHDYFAGHSPCEIHLCTATSDWPQGGRRRLSGWCSGAVAQRSEHCARRLSKGGSPGSRSLPGP